MEPVAQRGGGHGTGDRYLAEAQRRGVNTGNASLVGKNLPYIFVLFF